ncbi:MAG TPA: alpha/beta fold hydrolase [Acetobacteraceae bacterium]|jgi:pimeloyl-ACP methyl ester carboxylesterase|nr:alpha/beta fold hydrolase [Acetobacteraceae bacterium]
MPIYHTAAGLVEALEWGDGPELFVLLHAAATESHSLSSLATLLLRPDRRVIAPALDRYGATTTREGSDRVQAHVDVLRACTEIHPAERRVLFGHSMGGLIGLLGAIGGLVFDAMVLYEPIVTAWLRTDLPRDVALWDWDRMIAAEVVRGVSTGDPAGGIAASVTAWNEVPWSDLPSAVRA